MVNSLTTLLQFKYPIHGSSLFSLDSKQWFSHVVHGRCKRKEATLPTSAQRIPFSVIPRTLLICLEADPFSFSLFKQ